MLEVTPVDNFLLSENYAIISDMSHQAIEQHIATLATGQVFTPKSLHGYGSRANIDQVLSRLVKASVIQREARGLYQKPITSRFTGKPLPAQLNHVLEVIAQSSQEVIAPHGAVALNQFGLSTQNQLRPVFYTTGRSRKIKIGHQEVELRHVNPKRLPLGNSKAGLALTAMRYIGKKELEPNMVKRIRQQLEPADWQQVQAVRLTQPEWLIRLLESTTEANHV
jgi:hypothetical protein